MPQARPYKVPGKRSPLGQFLHGAATSAPDVLKRMLNIQEPMSPAEASLAKYRDYLIEQGKAQHLLATRKYEEEPGRKETQAEFEAGIKKVEAGEEDIRKRSIFELTGETAVAKATVAETKAEVEERQAANAFVREQSDKAITWQKELPFKLVKLKRDITETEKLQQDVALGKDAINIRERRMKAEENRVALEERRVEMAEDATSLDQMATSVKMLLDIGAFEDRPYMAALEEELRVTEPGRLSDEDKGMLNCWINVLMAGAEHGNSGLISLANLFGPEVQKIFAKRGKDFKIKKIEMAREHIYSIRKTPVVVEEEGVPPTQPALLTEPILRQQLLKQGEQSRANVLNIIKGIQAGTIKPEDAVSALQTTQAPSKYTEIISQLETRGDAAPFSKDVKDELKALGWSAEEIKEIEQWR